MKPEYAKIAGRYLSVPTGYAAFKHDLGGKITAPLEFAKDLCNIQHYTYFKDGGHFAAFEMPEELAKDVFTFFKKVYSA
uniref:Epoxide hydrolase n=1 Tax=Acrobeloides nanus TaxID=290746 RepID=A0A914EDY0_9BILA